MLPNCTQFRKILVTLIRAPAVLNQVRLPPLESLSQFLKKSVHDSPKTLVSVLLQKQGFTHNFLSTSTKKYSYLGNKNVLSKLKTHFCSLLSNFWIKLHCQYQRFTQLGASKLRFLNKLTN